MMFRIFKQGITALDTFEQTVNEWLKQPDVRIISKHMSANGDIGIFYETCSDFQHRNNWLTIQEDAVLDHLRDVARAVQDDKDYPELKNQQQREIYLLHRYGVNSKEADIVRELLRSEMAAVLNNETKKEG
jgi:hypothetical protein